MNDDLLDSVDVDQQLEWEDHARDEIENDQQNFYSERQLRHNFYPFYCSNQVLTVIFLFNTNYLYPNYWKLQHQTTFRTLIWWEEEIVKK